MVFSIVNQKIVQSNAFESKWFQRTKEKEDVFQASTSEFPLILPTAESTPFRFQLFPICNSLIAICNSECKYSPLTHQFIVTFLPKVKSKLVVRVFSVPLRCLPEKVFLNLFFVLIFACILRSIILLYSRFFWVVSVKSSLHIEYLLLL